MGSSVAVTAEQCHRRLTDSKPRLPNGEVRKADIDEWRIELGKAIGRAMAHLGWSLKELAAAVERDERQCARWIKGQERPQVDTLIACEPLRRPLVIELVKMPKMGVRVETTVRIDEVA